MRKVLTENLSNIRIPLKNEFNVELFMKPDYLNHLLISGNKLRKLKYNIEELKSKGFKRLLTFGGAYSNHIVATAAAGFENEIETIGVIRGQELISGVSNNPSLKLAKEMGMEFHFVSRADYRNKTSPEFISQTIITG